MLIDAAVTNSYILYKRAGASKRKAKLSHVAFQEEIIKALLLRPGAILRKRRSRHPHKAAVKMWWFHFRRKLLAESAFLGTTPLFP
jgi:hypothetical protein